jgi:hypothetical protein
MGLSRWPVSLLQRIQTVSRRNEAAPLWKNTDCHDFPAFSLVGIFKAGIPLDSVATGIWLGDDSTGELGTIFWYPSADQSLSKLTPTNDCCIRFSLSFFHRIF